MPDWLTIGVILAGAAVVASVYIIRMHKHYKR